MVPKRFLTSMTVEIKE